MRLKRQGYRDTTIKSWIALINWFFEYMNRQDLLLIERSKRQVYTPPVLTRDLYLRLLSAARALDDRQGYLLVKLFASAFLPPEGVSAVTVEAVSVGILTCDDLKAQINVDAIVMQMQERLMATEEKLIGRG